ncbi:MAG: hypothetical protein ACREXQ_18710, partial [Polaromonas sp.]
RKRFLAPLLVFILGMLMLLFICAREALRTFRRLDGPEPLVSDGFYPATFGRPACRQPSQERRQASRSMACW